MNLYIKEKSSIPSFEQNGLYGYKYNLLNDNFDFTYIDCFKGHDNYCVNLESTHLYYIIDGYGTFCIEDEKYEVRKGDVIEIPPNTEFVYIGSMKMLLIMEPGFNPKNDITTKENDLY